MRTSYLSLAAAVAIAGGVAATATAHATGSDHATPGATQSGDPGQSTSAPGQATTPGQSGAAPGVTGSTPGQTGATPANGAPAPGQAGDTPGQDGTAPGRASLPPAAPPVLGSSVRVAPDRGHVVVKLPRSNRFVALSRVTSLPTGAVVDATRGTINLTSAVDAAGHTQTGAFWGGRFTVAQGHGPRAVTRLTVAGARRSVCGSAARTGTHAAPSKRRARRRGSRVLGRLWGHDHHGRFVTSGRFASAAVRGTVWLTEDRCDGTLVVVRQGAVAVTDRSRHRTVLVRAGHRYLARAVR